MLDLVTEASTLGALLEETRGVVGVVLGTVDGEVRAVVGAVRDTAGSAMAAAAMTGALNYVGQLLGMGDLQVASVKAPTAARVFAQQATAVLVIELDPKRPIGDLEARLRTASWAPADEPPDEPAPSRASTTPIPVPAMRSSRPPPLPPLPPPPHVVHSQHMPPPPPHVAPPSHAPPPPQIAPPHVAAPLAAASLPPPTARPSPASGIPRLPLPSTHSGPQGKTVGTGPAFAGDLEEFALPDLLEFLRNSHRTGLLVCSTTTGSGSVQLSRGMIIAADSPHALDVREHLLSSAEIPVEQRHVLAALPIEYFGDDMIEGVLVSRDLVPRDEVERARVARIYSAFREMMAWTSGRFSFDPAVPIVTNPALALSAQSILMQIYQEQDEQSR